jgi:peroxiredoxin Q/BCP
MIVAQPFEEKKMRNVNLTMLLASYLSILLASSPAYSDQAPTPPPIDLKLGDAAPEFESLNEQGQAWKSSEHVGRKWIVVYFYPADFTTGCTKQAQTFRDNSDALVAEGVEVIGVSGDSVKSHELFKQAHRLNFTLLADEKGEIAEKFGVPVRRGAARVRPRDADGKPLLGEDGKPLVLERQATFARWTFVIGPDGVMRYKNTKAIPAQDSQQVLEFIRGQTTAQN